MSKEKSPIENWLEFSKLSKPQQKALTKHREAMEASIDFVKPYFKKFERFANLYNGVLPDCIDSTFSKTMLQIPFSIIQNELPRATSSILSTDDFFFLEAQRPELEYAKDTTKKWLLYQARKKNRIFPSVLPTMTRVNIFGTGWRVITHNVIHTPKTKRVASGKFAGIEYGIEEQNEVEDKLGIVAQNVDIWSILPSPHGNVVNTLDNESGEAVEWMHWIDYMSEAKLKAMIGKKYVDKAQVEHMLADTKSARDAALEIDREYIKKVQTASAETDIPDWIEDVRDNKTHLNKRYRCIWTFFRDRWMLIGENRWVLYDGPPLLDWIPISRYVDTPNLNDIYGRGLLEVSEDVILAYLLNFNFRMDYLAQQLHPSSWIRDDVLDDNNGGETGLDPTPYAVYKFSRKIKDIQRAVWRDRFPEISPQAFVEETGFKQLIQEVTAQPNYMKGMGGGGALANETATGIVSLIEEGTARSSMRSLTLEYTGVHDELMLMLKWGKKYLWQDEQIRSEAEGWPWGVIPFDMIDDGFGIELRGTRGLVHKNEMVKRMMQVLPMLMNNPNVPGQKELIDQALTDLDIFPNKEKFMSPARMELMAGVNGGAGNAGELANVSPRAGMGGAETIGNREQAVARALPETMAGQSPAQPTSGGGNFLV